VELLRKYLLKNHLWRTAQYKVPNQALVDDHLGWAGSEAFASDGFRNAIPLVGENNVHAGEFINPQRHLLGYGAGANGTYSSADGVGTASNFATDSVRTVFTNLYGDYFGDWDFETNPLMPALLASKGSVLTVSWAGRPHWMQHGLASGETIGYCLKETQNAQFNSAYGDSNGESGAHIALLGDPTLRAKIVAPATNLVLNSNCNKVNLHWTASADPEVVAYLIYRSFSQDGPYLRVSPDLVFQTSWEDLSPIADTLFYSVRAVKLEVTPGGGAFYNSSSGAPKSVIFVPGTGPNAIALGGLINCNVPSLTLGTNFNPPNSTVQWYQPNGNLLNGFTATEGGVYTVVVTAPNGCTTAAYATVYQDTALPQIILPGSIVANCLTPVPSFTIPNTATDIRYYYNGVEVFPEQIIEFETSSVFTVTSTANGCSKNYNIAVLQDFIPPNAQITHNGLLLDCQHPIVSLNSNTPNALYAWSRNGGPDFSFQANVEVSLAGDYCLTVTNPSNGCTSSSCLTVVESGSVLNLNLSFAGNPCASGARTLIADVTGGLLPYTYNWSNGASTQSIQLQENFTGNISVTVTDGNGCNAAGAIAVAPVISVLALTNEESTPGALDGYIDLLILNGLAPFTFLWSNGSTTEDITGLSSGTYAVTISSADGCTKVLEILLQTVDNEDFITKFDLKIIPNPASDQVGVYLNIPSSEVLNLRFTDLAGRLISAQVGLGPVFFFEVSDLPNGLYMLWLENEKGKSAYRVVVGR
jgi:hypothetical protein